MSSSKSILNPGRTMYSSHNGSLKSSQASPMFPSSSSSNVKKKTSRGGGFENHEPSSPKVTCIGQVRVMTKKQARKNRTAARSKSCRRNASYRKMDSSASTAQGGSLEMLNYPFQQQEGFSDRNQRWVHFPATICRAFGGEFNCFLPCKSSCTANEREKMDGSGGEEEEKSEENARISHRRHVFEGLDIENFVKESSKSDNVITSPPKNALLLMRCRFDPIKMGALAQQDRDFDGENNSNKVEKKRVSFKLAGNSLEENKVEIFMDRKAEKDCDEEIVSVAIKEDDFCIGVNEYVTLEEEGKDISVKAVIQTEQFEVSGDVSNGDVVVDQEKLGNQENELENEVNGVLVLPENELGGEVCVEPIMREEVDLEAENESEVLVEEQELEKEWVLEEIGVETVAVAEERMDEIPESSEEEAESVKTRHERLEPEIDQKTLETETISGSEQREHSSKQSVNITDSLSHDHHNHEPKKRTSIDSKPNNNLHFQPPRSSCSFPAAPPSRVVPRGGSVSGSRVCELSVLPRCKSEPRRSASKLAPEACFWKMEPHRPAGTMGVRAAGLGF